MSFITEVLSSTSASASPQNRWKTSDLVTAVVKENWNEKFPGCVKVEYILGEEGKYTSDWIRVLQPYAGKEYGKYLFPEIGSEVLVAFVSGDMDCAVVLGCFYNSQNTLPKDVPNKDNSIKYLKTKGGHEIRIEEEKGKEKIQIKTPGELQVLLSDEEEKVEVKDKSGSNKILLDSKNKQISIQSEKKIELVCGGAKLELNGTGNKVSLTGDQVEIKGNQSLKIESQSMKTDAAMTEIKASGTIKMEASGITQIKGAMVKLN